MMETTELFSAQDLEQLTSIGISLEEALRQVSDIRSGFPYLDIYASASLEQGIVRVDRDEEAYYMDRWSEYLNQPTASVCKMVPASGAASRMFKHLFAFLEKGQEQPQEGSSVRTFFDNISHFAFYDRLGEVCLRNSWKSIPKLIASGQYQDIIDNLLSDKGLGYGSMPKGLLLFHTYAKGSCTAAEEHLVEGALYAKHIDGKVRIHFTVSPEHRQAFEKTLGHTKGYYEDKYGVRYEISYSEQKPSTDTLALHPDGSLFRREDGKLLLRPGGHGALISNLSDLDADIVFIKNIDNVVPDHLKCATIMSKKLLGGILVVIRKQLFGYMRLLTDGKPSHSQLMEMLTFAKDNLCIQAPEGITSDDLELQAWLQARFDRPLRVCGMVRNQGEPGGGPFIIRESDGTTSLQILESSQINLAEDDQRALFQSGSYFNPVDLVCSLRNHRGEPYNLLQYVNPKTAFIASKTQAGQELLALERPGLWNGAMHHWNTIFVEVPIETFNPVNEVNDLLRPEHQGR